MNVLIATAMYPTAENPAFGSFVRAQVEALKQAKVSIELLVLQGRLRKLIYPKGIVQLRQRLATGSIDLVHAHYGYVGIVARTQWKVPVVVTYHGDDVLGTISEDGTHTYSSRLTAGAGRLLSRCVDAVIVQSKQMASKLKEANVYVIPHEVDFQTFRPVERGHARLLLGLNPEKKYLLFAANPQIAVKRFPLAKAVADDVASRDPSVELLVVHRETQDRLALYMGASDALIFPSFQEGSPNVVKQAMACNLPIAATDVGDVREIIGDTDGCFVCDPTVGDFAEKVSEMLRRRQRIDGRRKVRHLDSPHVARRIVQVYEDTLKRRAC
jgi:glycosyltransferase involved in cell wall biosynthesis